MASTPKPWLICGYFSLTIFSLLLLFIFSKPCFIFVKWCTKGTYVIKTLCNWMQKWRWVILPDTDITVASLNSLRYLALDFIVCLFFLFCFVFLISLLGGKHIKNARGSKSVYGSSRWPKHTRKCVMKKILSAITDIHIHTRLVFSEDHWVCWKPVGNLLWNYYRGCVRKTDVADLDRIKIVKYVCETQIFLTP